MQIITSICLLLIGGWIVCAADYQTEKFAFICGVLFLIVGFLSLFSRKRADSDGGGDWSVDGGGDGGD